MMWLLQHYYSATTTLRKLRARDVQEPSKQESSLQQQEVDHHHSPESFSLQEASKHLILQGITT